MDKRTYENWVRIKAEFEKSGNIEAKFYLRACEIVRTREDPFTNSKMWEKIVDGGSAEEESSEGETTSEDS